MRYDADDFAVQVAVWGWALYGAGDVSIRHVERPVREGMPAWDDPSVLDETRLNNERPPDWMACYWIGEHVRRGHAVLDQG